MTVLVTGFAGGLAREVARALRRAGREVVGVDYRPIPQLEGDLEGVETHRAQYHKTAIDDVFRRRRYEAVLHLGRVGNLSERMQKRFDLNVMGTRRLFASAKSYGVRRLVVLSTFHVYGASPANHTPISEEDPLRAGPDFPEIADAIQLDAMATQWAFQHPEVGLAVLRPTNVVGAAIDNTMSRLLRRERVPKLLGFNPMTQFIHARDLAEAIVAAMNGTERGVFNVAGATAIPWDTAIDIVGARRLPVPGSIAMAAVRAFSTFPAYLVNFLKYPCVITDGAFRKAFGWRPALDMRATLEDVRRTRRVEEGSSASGSESAPQRTS